MAKKVTAAAKLAKLMKAIKQQGQEEALERQLKDISTKEGAATVKEEMDAETLDTIAAILVKVKNENKKDETDKDISIFPSKGLGYNLGMLVSISSIVQWLTQEQKDLVPPVYLGAFSQTTMEKLAIAAGRLPWEREPLTLEINGVIEILNQEAVDLAKAGTKPDLLPLLTYANNIGAKLGLMCRLEVTQSQLDAAWVSALIKQKQVNKLQEYDNSLEN